MGDKNLKQYYAKRAAYYERIYTKPERQIDLNEIRNFLQAEFENQDILEIACGTGYWTQPISKTAKSIFATDANKEVIDVAKQKLYEKNNVKFEIADAFKLDNISGLFSAGFSGFWWSHISLTKIREFLKLFHSKLAPNSQVIFIDNQYVEGNNNPMSDNVDVDGNTYSIRILDDGKKYEILKNFPTDEALKNSLTGIATSIEIKRLTYYWCLSYRALSSE